MHSKLEATNVQLTESISVDNWIAHLDVVVDEFFRCLGGKTRSAIETGVRDELLEKLDRQEAVCVVHSCDSI